jgi:GYF domain 2
MNIYIQQSGQDPEGPYSVNALNELLKHNIINDNDYAWHEGLEDWILVRNLTGLVIVNESTKQNKILENSPFLLSEAKNQIKSPAGIRRLHSWGLKEIQTAPSNHNQFNCPYCESDSIQKVSIIYAEGTNSYSTTTSGLGILGLGTDHLTPIGISGRSYVEQKSALAKKYSPPTLPITLLKSANKIFILAVTIVPLLLLFLWLLLLLLFITFRGGRVVSFLLPTIIVITIFGFVFHYMNAKSNEERNEAALYEKDYPFLKSQWDNSWYCHKCGYFGVL